MTRLLFPLFFFLSASAAIALDYNRDVRPTLSNNCFLCHGPDEEHRKAKLRLDIPGQVDADEVIARISSTDPEEMMPPPESNKSLKPDQIALLTEWVKSGAEYQEHWAFVPPKKASVPDAAHPVDHFLPAQLPQADSYTLVRRVYLDLIGIPPTPEEADTFAADPSPAAYEKLVDQLLASPKYGERWARRWLDLARYADTNGYEKDRDRSIWPYRDWVIKALNADMPFDQFTIAQLAGDMLPGATREQLIATGFHRNTMLNEEGGIDPLEFRFHAMTDRVATTGTTWLGLTIGCAQCHTHKYDPVTHTDYYGMMAFLNNADEPEMALPNPGDEEQFQKNLASAQALLEQLPSQWPASTGDSWQALQPVSATTSTGQIPKVLDDASVLFADACPDKDTYAIELHSDAKKITQLRLETLTHEQLPQNGPGRVEHGNFVLTEIEITANGNKVEIASATASAEQDGFPVQNTFDQNPATGWAVHQKGEPLNQDRHAIFKFSKPIESPNGVRFKITLHHDYGSQHLIGRARFSIPADSPATESPEDNRERAFAAWLKTTRESLVKWQPLVPDKMSSNLPFLKMQEDGSIFVSGDTTKNDTYELAITVPQGTTALQLEALPDDRLPDRGPGTTYYEGRKGDFFLNEFRITTTDGSPVKIADASETYAKNKFNANPVSAKLAIDGDSQTGWSVSDAVGQRQVAVFNLAGPLDRTQQLTLRMHFGRHYASSLGRFRLSATTDPKGIQTKATTVSPDQDLKQAFLMQAPELATQSARIRELQMPLNSLTTLVFNERPKENPRPTFRHHRGEFLSPKEAVQPRLPEILPQLPDNAEKNRLAFAKWLVSRENPLTARVTVNRQWHAFFGQGIVTTLDDFGLQGTSPTHPALLDWLAVDFMENGWSLKRLHKQIVNSATYRQQSTGDGFPRTRLEAEIIRDATLSAAGLLSDKMYGPPVRPPQPGGVTEVAYGSPSWNASTGEDRYRRSIYTYIKRTAPFAQFTTFDAGSGEACIAKRDVSNSPLQALTILNDIMFTEAAQAMGRALAKANLPPEQTLTKAFRQVLTRPPQKEETTAILTFYQSQKSRMQSGDLNAKTIAGTPEEAAWTLVARSLFALDEAITKQ